MATNNELDVLEATNRGSETIMDLIAALREERERVEILRDALRFYAAQSLPGQSVTLANMDGGTVARQALANDEGK